MEPVRVFPVDRFERSRARRWSALARRQQASDPGIRDRDRHFTARGWRHLGEPALVHGTRDARRLHRVERRTAIGNRHGADPEVFRVIL